MVASRLIQDQAFASKQVFPRDQGSGNRLPGSVIDY